MYSDVYWQFAKSVRERLCDEVNGRVVFEIYEKVDTVIFKIYFKEFDFKYAVNDIQTLVYEGRIPEKTEEILKVYRSAILDGFFKTENRKKRDAKKRYGQESFV